MKTSTPKLLVSLFFLLVSQAFSQSYNPFNQNIHYDPEPSKDGFACGSSTILKFTQGLTTLDDAPLDPMDPLLLLIDTTGFAFDDPVTALNSVGGSYSINFDWSFDALDSSILVGTQNRTLTGTGSNPLGLDPNSTGDIFVFLNVPNSLLDNTTLGAAVSLDIPAYMTATDSAGDNTESSFTQSHCAVPEPASASLLGIGVVLIGLGRKRRK